MKISLKTAHEDILQNHVLLFLIDNKKWSIRILISCVVFGLIFSPTIFNILLGVTAAYLSLVVIYYFRALWFIKTNRSLCPKCAHKLSTIACQHCSHDIPYLAFVLRGLFLSRCPNCSRDIPSLSHLLAKCSGEQEHTFKRPEQLYGRPTINIVWVVKELPGINQVNPEWEFFDSGSKTYSIFFYKSNRDRSDKHSTSGVYFLKAARLLNEKFPLNKQITQHTRLLLISDDLGEILEPVEQQVRGHFTSSKTKTMRVSSLH